MNEHESDLRQTQFGKLNENQEEIAPSNKQKGMFVKIPTQNRRATAAIRKPKVLGQD